MRRRAFLGLLLAAPTAAVVGLPVTTPAWGRPRPVPATVHRIPLRGVDRTAASGLRLTTAGSRAPLHLTARTATAPFSLLGVTWLGKQAEPGRYVVELAGSGEDDRALPYRTVVVVRGGDPCRGTPLQRAKCKITRRYGAASSSPTG